MKTADIAAIIIDEASSKFSPEFVESDYKKRSFYNICDIIDGSPLLTRASELQVDINTDAKTIILSITNDNFVLPGGSTNAELAMMAAKNIRIDAADGGVKMILEYNGIWEAAE